MRDPNAFLFDLDGTLVDSEPLHQRAIVETLHDLGVEPGAFAPREFVGIGERDFWAHAKERFALADPVAALIERKDERYVELARESLRAMRGAATCLERVRSAGLRLAVASGSTPRAIATSLAVVGLGHFFEQLVSVLDPDVEKGKPEPDVFLAAARRLGVEAERCTVVEDTEAGVKAGRAAGMRVVAVPNDWTRGAHDFSRADRVVSSLDEIGPEEWTRAPGER